jgi:predicted permease
VEIVREIRHAGRALRRSPSFTATALAALALATGANSAVFSLVYSVILRPLPFPAPSRLVSVTNFYPAFKQSAVIGATFLDWRDGLQTPARIAAYSMGDFTVSGADSAERATAALVSKEYFDTLGAKLLLGRAFTAEEDSPGNDAVAIVSEGYWRARLGGDRDLARHSLEMDGRRRQIVGVLANAGEFPPGARIWVPLALDPVRERQGGPWQLVRVIGRLAPGETESGLAARLEAISRRLAGGDQPYGAARGFTTGSRIAVEPLRAWLTGKTRQIWLALLAAVGLVVLVACANVAGMALARGAARRREMAVRLALGASGARLARHLLVESALLAAAGSTLGLLLGAGLLRAALPLVPDAMLAGRPVALDLPVFLFTAAVAALTAALFGVAPARTSARIEISEALQDGGRTSVGRAGTALNDALVAAEVALSLAVLATAGLMARSFVALSAVDPGFRADHALSFSVNLPRSSYSDAGARRQLYARSLRALAALPGVRAAGLASALPFGGGGTEWAEISVEGEAPWDATEGARRRIQVLHISEGYLAAAGAELTEGRAFLPADAGGNSVLVSQNLARRFFGGQSAVGRRIKTGFVEGPGPWLTIIGVVRDVASTALDAAPDPALYEPYEETGGLQSAGFVLRTAGDPAGTAGAARRAIAAIDRGVAVADVQTMEQRLAASMASARLRFLASALLAALALAIVVTGLYGALSYLVARRTAELGVRIALGASPAEIFGLVLRRGLGLAASGACAGLGISLASARLLNGLLFAVSPEDPWTLGGATLLMLAVAAAASAGPAWRATRTDPMRCLREER